MSAGQQAGVPQRRLEELPRPVVAFLSNRCRIPLRRAVVTSLRDLDKEGLVRFGADPGGTPLISLGAARGPWSGRPLLPYEETALERVRTRLGTQPSVPLSALLSDDGDDYQLWAKRQVSEIAQEAGRAGLARKSFPRYIWPAALTLAVAAICAAIVVHLAHPKATGVTGAAVAVVVLSLIGPLFLRRWRLTAEGAAAVDSWRRDGQGLAGAARDPGAVGQQTLWALTAPGGAPLPPGHAWSSLGGQWHTVRLGLELKPPFWSSARGLGAVLALTVFASFFTAIIGGAAEGFDQAGKLLAISPAALAALVVLVCWIPAFAIRMGQPDNVTFTGEVVRQWHVNGGEYSPDRDWVCIDNGSPTTMKFDVTRATYQQLSVGDLVYVSWSPRHRRLNSIEHAR